MKQQKKSSSKWTCVVCNQKQSVRKVFAQGYKAKDVRLFVQNFNMSRQFTDQLPVVGREETETLEIGEQNQSHRSYKRTDWTEYLDPEENAIENNEDSGRLIFIWIVLFFCLLVLIVRFGSARRCNGAEDCDGVAKRIVQEA